VTDDRIAAVTAERDAVLAELDRLRKLATHALSDLIDRCHPRPLPRSAIELSRVLTKPSADARRVCPDCEWRKDTGRGCCRRGDHEGSADDGGE